jgi:hypothetical protein
MEYWPLLDTIKIQWKWVRIEDLKNFRHWETKKMYEYIVKLLTSHISRMNYYWITKLPELDEDKFILKQLTK